MGCPGYGAHLHVSFQPDFISVALGSFFFMRDRSVLPHHSDRVTAIKVFLNFT